MVHEGEGEPWPLGRVLELRTYPSVDVLVVQPEDGGAPWERPRRRCLRARGRRTRGPGHPVHHGGPREGRDPCASTSSRCSRRCSAASSPRASSAERSTGATPAVRLRSPRDFGLGKHRSVDDTPYGGGSGMVIARRRARRRHGVARRGRARGRQGAPGASDAAGGGARPEQGARALGARGGDARVRPVRGVRTSASARSSTRRSPSGTSS